MVILLYVGTICLTSSLYVHKLFQPECHFMLNMSNSDISKEIPIKYQTFMNVQVAFNIVSMSILFKEFTAKMCIYTCLQTEVYVIYNKYIAHAHTHTT